MTAGPGAAERDRRRPGGRRGAAAVVAVLLTLVVGAGSWAGRPAGAAEPVDGSVTATPGIRVTGVDASTTDVELSVIGADAGVTPAEVALTSGTAAFDVTGTASALASGVPTELVVVVDVNARGVDSQVVEAVKAALASWFAELPPGVTAGLVAAGDSALIGSRLTNDTAVLTAAVAELSPRNGAALFKGIERASALFSTGAGVNRSIVVVSTGGDLRSGITSADVQTAVVSRGIQLVSLRYDRGEPALEAVARASGGLDVETGRTDLDASVPLLLDVAADRLVISFAGTAEPGTRTNLRLEVAGAATELSYPAGSVVTSVPQLAVQKTLEPAGMAFFRTSVGLWVSLGLAFLGITLGIWSLASIMAGRESSLEGLLSRYADGPTDLTDGEVTELIVQSALLKRAVSFSESFAAKRGFLFRVEELLEKADLPIRPGEAMFGLVATAGLGSAFAAVVTRSIVTGLLIGAALIGLSFFALRYLARRRLKRFEALLPDTLQLLAGTLRAGYSLPQGMEVVSHEVAEPMGKELRRAMAEARLGRDLEDCLSSVAERMGSPDFAWAVMAIGIQREVGGNLNELLNSVADTMIARERLRREVGALTAEGRMSAIILSVLPPGLGLIMWTMNPAYISLLFTDMLGNILLGLGVVSAMVGLAWMKKVITIDV